MRWVLALQTFDFHVQYKPRKSHCNADVISRHSNPPKQLSLTDEEYVKSLLMHVNEDNQRLEDLKIIVHYLRTFSWPSHVTKRDLRHLNLKLRHYCLLNEILFHRAVNGRPPRRVIFTDKEKEMIVKANHEGIVGEGGHRGINSCVRKILINYKWASGDLYKDVRKHVMTCLICQKCELKVPKEPIHVAATSWIFYKLYIDCIDPMHRTCAGHDYIVVAMEDLTGYIEAWVLKKKNAKSIAQFIWDDVITRHGCFMELVSDRGIEFKNSLMNELTARLGVDQKFVASYHPEANGRAERSVQKLTKVLQKLCAEKQNHWHEYLREAVWAINIMVREIGYSPFHLVYGRDAVTPVELMIDTYQMFVMKMSWTTEELLEYRALQIKNLSYELENVQVNWDEIRERWKLF